MNRLNHQVETVSAFAPATVSNIAVGFDLLGFPIEAVGDTVTLTRTDRGNIEIVSSEALPKDPHKNTASAALLSICQHLQITEGFHLHIKKGIPLSSGMGGSAASAVAAVVAFNQFLQTPLTHPELIRFALQGEAVASGTVHGDNVVPCLYGGLTLIHQLNPPRIIPLPIPDIFCVLIHPHFTIETAYARSLLPKAFPLTRITQQSAHLAAFMVALFKNDLDLLQHCLIDVLIEPLRAKLVKNFFSIKNAALNHGALGCSLSGSGPSLFALARCEKSAALIAQAMQEAFQEVDIKTDYWISKIMPTGAYVITR